MDKKTAIKFLSENQPMPNDNLLTKEIIDTYYEVLVYAKNNPDNEFIPLILNSFGEWDGLGVYQTVEDAILNFDKNNVVEVLKHSLQSSYSSIKYWCAQISGAFHDDSLIDSLTKLVKDENADIRISAYISLSNYSDNVFVSSLLRHRLEEDDDPEAQEILSQIVNDFS